MIYWVILLFGLLSGCTFHFDKCPSCPETPPPVTVPPGTPPPTPTTPITFKQLKNTVLDVFCLKCHNGIGGQGGVDLSTYNSTLEYVIVGNGKDSKICKEVVSKAMPKDRPMPDPNITMICQWIEQGAKEK